MSKKIDPRFDSAQDAPADNPYTPPKAHLGVPRGSGRILAYQRAGRVIRLMAWLGVMAVIGMGAAILMPAMALGRPPAPALVGTLVFMTAFVIGLFFVAHAVMHHRPWGRIAGIAYGAISLLGFPLGTLIGAYLLWRLIWGWDDHDAA